MFIHTHTTEIAMKFEFINANTNNFTTVIKSVVLQLAEIGVARQYNRDMGINYSESVEMGADGAEYGIKKELLAFLTEYGVSNEDALGVWDDVCDKSTELEATVRELHEIQEELSCDIYRTVTEILAKP